MKRYVRPTCREIRANTTLPLAASVVEVKFGTEVPEEDEWEDWYIEI